ncbi:hypothetical protein [Nitrosarchaeum sp. AC2]|uniref:hypothetical protein n=1 Tax=Nitrosarchaeum sp. AC2 TaxID=2259673 RepID=UPI0015CA0BE4|nr:hypothetical protein [Nitrosarchaeum sp. AC2]QLH11255.1 hypothetical protein DSQ20_07125 [Nitrosarchaeum sp. AC2]
MNKEEIKKLSNILQIIADNLEKDPDLLDKIETHLFRLTKKSKKTIKQKQIDLFEILSKEGESALNEKLNSMELIQLKNIVRSYSLDSSKLAEKWKNKERLIKFIAKRIIARSAKGKVFSTY